MTNTTHVVKCFSTALVSEGDAGRRKSTDRWAAKFEISEGQYVRLEGDGECPYQLNAWYQLSMRPAKEVM